MGAVVLVWTFNYTWLNVPTPVLQDNIEQIAQPSEEYNKAKPTGITVGWKM